MNKKQYITSCVNSSAELINNMIEHKTNREITYETFLKHIDIDDLKTLFPFYDWGNYKNLTLKRDCYVSYFKSYYNNQPCVYMIHSAIEYVFV